MASWTYTSGTLTAKSLAGGETGVVGRDAIINSTTDNAIVINNSPGESTTLLIAGQVLSGNGAAISGLTHSCNVVLAETGVAAGIFGMSFWATTQARFSNNGEVLATLTGMSLLAMYSTSLATINNGGRIFGGEKGISLNTVNITTAAVINNSGEIEGGKYGIIKNADLNAGVAGILKITNSGTISGDVFALDLKAGNDRVLNSGLINGKIDLGAGDDAVNTRFGEIRGTVTGGLGLDSFRPGTFEDSFDGGGDADTLDLRGAGGVAVDLRNILENTEVAEGDVYLNVENVIGSGAADRIFGSSLANTLRGMGGADVIDGDAGADVITGGAGLDTLSGGAGNDQFIFLGRNELGDTIVDFGDSAGNEDQLRISAAALGGGVVAGAVAAGTFISRTSDHTAQDGNDRFILNKADKTLWFDADGTGGGVAILVVDLQYSTTFGVGDMILI